MSTSFKTRKGTKVSRETIRTSLKKEGLRVHRLRKTPRLTPDQKARRVAFAKKYSRFDFTKAAFWDETEFELISTPNPKNDIVWDVKGSEHTFGKVAHPATFKFGAAITVHGPTPLVPYKGTIKSEIYIEMVEEVVPDINKKFSNHKWTWIQDGARPHVSKYSMEKLKELVPDLIPPEDYPANSPDDNAAENIFGIIESEVQAKKPQTLKALEQCVRSAWRALTPETCANCISAIPKRLKQIIKSNGEYVYEVKGDS